MSRLAARRYVGACLLLGAGIPALSLLAADPQPAGTSEPASPVVPEYQGTDLKLPRDYRRWVFVGSNLGLRYGKNLRHTTPRESDRVRDDEVGSFHNVYINPEAYAEYLASGTFPVPTILVMEVYEAHQRDAGSVLTHGHFPGALERVEVAVKNDHRPDGSKTEWAYYDFGLASKPAAAFEDAVCYKCHQQHASDDNVWVQFYPILRDKKP